MKRVWGVGVMLALLIAVGCLLYAADPVAVCKSHTVYLDASGNGSLVPADVDGGSYDPDESSPYNLSVDISSFDCSDLGNVSVTLTITEDPPGTASASCVATVTVADNIAPVISGCPSNITVNNDPGVCGAAVTWTSATATDNCGIASFGPDHASGSTFPVGTTTVTYTAMDTSGNSSTCSFTVTVNDTEAPVITGCPSNITQGTDTGQCRARVYWTAPTATDNCGVLSLVPSKTSGSWFSKGTTTTVTYTATDIYGNKATCSFTVTVYDDDPPVISGCPSDFTQSNDAGKCDAVVTWTAPTVTDNCTGVTMTPDIAPGSTFPVGTTAVTYTATDTSGNTATCSFNVTVVDSEAPAIAGCPANITQSNDVALCSASVTWAAPTATDNCPGVVLISTHAPGDVFPHGTTTVTYTATDGASNTATCTFTVTVNDAEAPTITGGPGNITQSTDPGVCNAVVTWTDPVAADNCGVATFAPDKAPGSTFAKGTTTVIYTATDTSGNTAAYSFTVKVQDTEAPVISGCPGDITVNTAPGTCSAVVSWTAPTRTDNCGVTYWQRTAGPAPGSSFPKGKTTITYTAKDAANNVTTCTFNVIVVDNELPVITGCPSNITQNTDPGKCNAVVTWTAPTASDNCGMASWTSSHNPGATFPKGTTTVSYTAVDTSGNTATCTFSVTIVDSELPVITGCPANITKNTDPGLCTAVATWTAPSVSDNCGGLAAWGPDYPSGYAFPVGVTTVTYTAIDTSGNTATCSFTVTVNEVQPPTAVCKNATVSLDALGQATVTAAQVDGGSTDNCGIATLSVAPSAFTCANLGPNTVVLTVTDYAGNSATCNATVTVADLIPPVISGLPGNITQANDAGVCGAVVSWAAPSATDNCSIASFTTTHSSGSFFSVGSATTVTYTAVDGSGNSTTGSFTVTVTDTELPTITCPANISVGTDTGVCSASGVSLGSPTTSDNCSVASTTNDAPTVFPLGDTFVTWTVTDGAGNGATCQQKVTVVDDDAPTAVCKAAALQLDASGSATLTPDMVDGGSSDPCGSVTLAIDKTSFSCANLGANTVVLTVTDGAGNSSTCNATVTVVDALAPVISGCPGNITVSAGSGSCSATASWTAPSATDNCGLASFAGSHVSGSTFPVGTTTVTYTATDTSGNTAVCSFTVTVTETVPPTISGCPANIVQNNDPGLCSAVVTWTMPTGSDNCALASVSCSPAPGSVFPVGTTPVTCTATDTSGNTATCSFTVTVVDAEAPVIAGCPANITQNNDVGLCSAVVNWAAPTAADNCPGVVLTSSHAPGAVFPKGTTTV
ncbi:MAG: HYR domain-containing protein, partial [Candidatus Bipolaricaulota bacterium]